MAGNRETHIASGDGLGNTLRRKVLVFLRLIFGGLELLMKGNYSEFVL